MEVREWPPFPMVSTSPLSPVPGEFLGHERQPAAWGAPGYYPVLRASTGEIAVFCLKPVPSKPTSLTAPLQLWTRGHQGLQGALGLLRTWHRQVGTGVDSPA